MSMTNELVPERAFLLADSPWRDCAKRLLRRACLLALAMGGVCLSPLAAEDPVAKDLPCPRIQHVDLIHFSHTDYGYSDHPVVCREMQRRGLDIAIDAVLATADKPPEEKFCWTAETTVAVDDWWRAATPERRQDFLKAVRSGQLDVSALALNQTPTLSRPQWHTMLHWLPEDLWRAVQPKVALQNDVNGLPRAGAMALLDRDIHYFFIGINPEFGGPPLKTPAAFWWRMPDRRKLFVWLGYPYWEGYLFFAAENWRRGYPAATDTRYRPPRPGEILAPNEAAVRKAHGRLLTRIRSLEAEGYRYRRLLLSVMNEWRIDNDPPLPPLAEFVAEWSRLGLKPTLRLTTASVAMKCMEREVGRDAPVYEGEWTDWWANGVASGPHEVSASRLAKRLAGAAASPVWGPLDGHANRALDEIYRDLCLFDEHTWGFTSSISLPDDLETLGQYNEKSRYAYRPVGLARLLLSQRVRTRLTELEEGVYLANTSRLPWSGWITVPVDSLRGDYKSVKDVQSGIRSPIEFRSGPALPPASVELTPDRLAAMFPEKTLAPSARFWVDQLDGGAVRRLLLRKESVTEGRTGESSGPTVATDQNRWPTGASWPEMTKPLFLPGLGDILVVGLRGPAPRQTAQAIWAIADNAQRTKMRAEKLEETLAAPSGKTSIINSAHTTVYTQLLHHPRFRWAVRQLELWKRQPRARLTLRFDRLSSARPEAIFVAFTLPCKGVLPRLSNGGMPFVPFQDQVPGTCRDYFAIDGWAHYPMPEGHWLWVSRDAPLLALGEHNTLAKRTQPPQDTHRMFAMVFNNLWHTNFVADSHGVMEFQFELAWKKTLSDEAAAAQLAESLLAEPQIMINPKWKESPLFLDRLYRP
jgi:hypothetical protein